MRSFLLFAIFAGSAYADVFGTVRGVVHDPGHRPIAGAEVTLRAAASDYRQTAETDISGEFEFRVVPVGEYKLQVRHEGFADLEEDLVVASGNAAVVHIPLSLATQTTSVEVTGNPEAVNPQSSTPETLVSRQTIDRTPGADLTNSLAMITDFVPGAYMTHDQLHVRGGHQVTWAIDGVPIPNTNIASNVGPQIDPKDIDYLEVSRGGYSAEDGDRTYGVFNVVPRTGFELNREGEVTVTYGAFNQTNDQINFGDHTQRMAWFASVDGNRSDYGLETPGPAVSHDRAWGTGGFGSLIYNSSPSDQLRLVGSLRGDDYQVPDTADVERERDGVATFTWAHTFSSTLLLTASPFFHFNRADYDGAAETQHRDSAYAGAQIALSAITKRHNARVGVYGFGQHDDELVELAPLSEQKISTGHLEAVFLEDQFKLTNWLTLTGGVRLTHFSGAISENAANPRTGVALRIPKLNWVLHGFWGRYYQAPPLSTVTGPLLDLAVSQGFGFIPLRGERDEENQAGLTIPLRGWTFDTNSFRQRAVNYFDHNAIGNSNIFFPLSIAGARISGWEFTMRSPRLFRRAQASIAYSYQHAEGEGAITGGLTDFSPPEDGWFFLDHDQRHTLHANFEVNLPGRAWAAGGMYYGSGFTDGSSDIPKHLDPHTTFDLSLGKALGEKWSVSVVGLNVANRRFLLDNSETFGGTHYAEPRKIYVQVRYRFRW